ncbi:MAG TPA: YifB family Mg chelatase-like AAA ATPase [Tepidisphaeraceae bacterium]|nr:YifB family Mg chelatase-like AAA ATPase [Tepidisphaeraceae bacterium]
MLSRIHSYILVGIDALPCEVEADVGGRGGVEKVTVVGLAQTAVKESIDRVYRAMVNSGYSHPGKDVVINLAPADVKKEGPSLDLPIAIGLLRGTNFIQNNNHKDFLIAGELALDGRVRKIRGGLSLAILAKEMKKRGVILPAENALEAAVVDGVEVYPVSSLAQAVSFLNETLPLPPFVLDGESYTSSSKSETLDFADVRGQEAVKRAITIAAAGQHNILMIGPPGTGKTMLASRIPGIMPPLTRNESLETTRIYSALGLLPEGVALLDQRPCRSPHHSASAPALIGGGAIPKPGEVSLAHHGVLFLDELPEFSRYALEMLRQPLEGGEVNIARVHGSIKFPARFMLVAATNPTASGHDPKDPRHRDKYLSRLSGPLVDRIDIHVEVPTVPYKELTGKRAGTDSGTMKRQVDNARSRQRARFGDDTLNSQMSSKLLQKHGNLSETCLLLMKQAMDELGLSARAYDKVRRVARTIADMDLSDEIQEQHLAEAVQYRLLDRKQ